MIDPGTVRFASICDDEHGFTRSFLLSLLPLLAVDLGGEQRIWRGGYTIQGATSSGVVEGRNEVAREFLDSSAEWLFFVDSDMGFEPDALERLLEVADPEERPIVGGLCFGFGPIKDRMAVGNALIKKPFPTIFDFHETEDDAACRARWDYVPGAVQQCGATGAALLLIHRSVLQAIADKFGPAWFDRMRHPKAKKLWGEDVSFCARAGLLGFPVYVHAGVQSSHSKVIMVTQEDFFAAVKAPPATERVAVVVPVLNRPRNAGPFMDSLLASTGMADVFAVCSEDADADAWAKAGAQVIRSNRTTFACKANDALAKTQFYPWLLFVGDDVQFHPGWLDHALHVANTTGADVIATNDMANARVMAGEHATHPLIRRRYIDEQGASWDGPGKVAHEGYKHWFVDDEWTTVAKRRGVFAPALASRVEHLHPIFGGAPMDATYELGQKSAKLDKETFEKRAKRHLVAA